MHSKYIISFYRLARTLLDVSNGVDQQEYNKDLKSELYYIQNSDLSDDVIDELEDELYSELIDEERIPEGHIIDVLIVYEESDMDIDSLMDKFVLPFIPEAKFESKEEVCLTTVI